MFTYVLEHVSVCLHDSDILHDVEVSPLISECSVTLRSISKNSFIFLKGF